MDNHTLNHQSPGQRREGMGRLLRARFWAALGPSPGEDRLLHALDALLAHTQPADLLDAVREQKEH